MSNKKTRQDIEPENQESLETPAEIPAEPSLEAEAGQTVSLEEFEALKKQLEENQAQAAEYKDGWQRAVADFQNYRKRVERENSGVYQNA
ncbi:MAG: nucleotide exchange factor GrpE, partial [Anaerolineae bacterium CG_4_9_14_0_8_um_filter_58_9]